MDQYPEITMRPHTKLYNFMPQHNLTLKKTMIITHFIHINIFSTIFSFLLSINPSTWFACIEHLGTTSLLWLAIRSSSWFTRKDGGRAWNKGTNGPMIQWPHDPINQWTNEPMTLWPNVPMNQWTNAKMNQWTNETMNQWFNESMNQWINESMNHRIT